VSTAYIVYSLQTQRPPTSTLFPYTTLFRSTITTTQANANSGAVNIVTAGALTVGDIVTDGGAAAVNSVGKNAGTVTLNAGTLLTTAQISAKGSAAESTDLATRAGGTGNSVDLTGATRIDLGGNIDTSGGAGAGTVPGVQGA